MMRLRLHSEHQLVRRPRVPFISAGLMRKEGIGSTKEARRKAAAAFLGGCCWGIKAENWRLAWILGWLSEHQFALHERANS